jgi:hypothetical protein
MPLEAIVQWCHTLVRLAINAHRDHAGRGWSQHRFCVGISPFTGWPKFASKAAAVQSGSIMGGMGERDTC